MSQQENSRGVELLVCPGPSTAMQGLSAAAAEEKQYLEMNLEQRQGKIKEISALWPSLALKQLLPNRSGILYFCALNAAPVCLIK